MTGTWVGPGSAARTAIVLLVGQVEGNLLKSGCSGRTIKLLPSFYCCDWVLFKYFRASNLKANNCFDCP